MFIEIMKTDFRINASNVPSTLKSILEAYPEIKQNAMFKHRAGNPVAEQLQFALYLLGLHVRINPQGYMFGLKSLILHPLVPNDYMETLEILSEYAAPGSWIKLKVDDKPVKIEFDDLKKEREIKQAEKEKMKKEEEIKKREYWIPEPENIPLTEKQMLMAKYSETVALTEEDPEKLKKILDEKFPDEVEKEEIPVTKKRRGRKPKEKTNL